MSQSIRLAPIVMLLALLGAAQPSAGEPAQPAGAASGDGTITITDAENSRDRTTLGSLASSSWLLPIIRWKLGSIPSYTIRAKFAPGTMSRPHSLPEARYITVLKGTWWAGTGPKFDRDATVPVPQGGFAVHTPGKVHYDGAKDEEVIVQISGIGPGATDVVDDGK